jgi:hypothetical protein
MTIHSWKSGSNLLFILKMQGKGIVNKWKKLHSFTFAFQEPLDDAEDRAA